MLSWLGSAATCSPCPGCPVHAFRGSASAGTFWRSLPGVCTLLGPSTCGAPSRLPSSSSSRGGLAQSPRSAPQDSGPPRLSRCCPGLPLQPPLTTSSRLLINIFGVPPCHLRPDLPKTGLSNVPALGYPFPPVAGAWGQPVPPLGARQRDHSLTLPSNLPPCPMLPMGPWRSQQV